jgi:hypothetical protein
MAIEDRNRKAERSCSSQYAELKKKFPEWNIRLRKNQVVAVGSIQPTAWSRKYLVELKYSFGNRPKVRVLSPELMGLACDRKIPHMYSQKHLCLFYPKSRQWTLGDSIAEFQIPWISLWLYFFELWLITDKWQGGGIHIDD